jgi:hypothetical protein
MHCFFCGLPHTVRNCPSVDEYVRLGRVIREDRYFLYPDRSAIRRRYNGTIKEAVDERWGPVASPPATGANATAPDPKKRDSPPHMPAAPSAAFISETYFLQCSPVAENHAVLVEVEEDVETQEAGVHAITRSKSKVTSDAGPSSPPYVQNTRTNDHQGKMAITDAKRTPAFTYESKAASPDATQRVYQQILNMVVPSVTVADLLGISTDLRKEAVEHCRAQRIPAPSALSAHAATTDTPMPPPQVEHATPLRELRVTLNGVHSELGLLDEGSEIVVIREDAWRKTNAPRNEQIHMRMQTANGGSQDMGGCVEMLEIDIEGIKTWAHAYVVPDAPYRLLLGRPWQRLVRLSKTETLDDVHVTVHDPLDSSNIRTCRTLPRPWPNHGSFTTTAAAFASPTQFPTNAPWTYTKWHPEKDPEHQQPNIALNGANGALPPSK